MSEHDEPSSGVRNLIERVKSEGVEAGREEAERIVNEARARAARIVEDARREAEQHLERAREQERTEQESGRAALQLAARDAVLRLEEELSREFARQLHRLVDERLKDPRFLERLIIELVGRDRPEPTETAEVLLPEEAIRIDQLREKSPELERDPVDGFVLSVARDMLRDGVSIRASRDLSSGLVIRLEDGDVEVEVTTETVTELLSGHLLPRFRGLLEGVFR
jgi:V/A-type H+-transporting ATPase subunit E